jgi:two-component system, LytTR family, sensor kinase
MKYPEFRLVLLFVLYSSVMLVLGLYLLANFKRLFRRLVKNELLRKNIVVWMIAVCLILAVSPTNGEFYQAAAKGAFLKTLLIQITAVTILTVFVFNTTLLVLKIKSVQRASFRKKMGIVLFTIVLGTMVCGILVNYLGNGGSFKGLELTLVFNFWTGSMTGLVYVTMSYVDLERQKKMNEKELEVLRLRELKTKAELDALHSKINPHFLYNALNSIADLSITDGKKARKMTVALADLFRYSINYSDHNYSTVKEEVEMTEVYLQIEKIRFEDKLNYSINIAENVNHYLIPRFVLQPVVENAVKHGLKATGNTTEIDITVKNDNGGLQLTVADNGPAFPDELVPGYGVKSMYDKLDLLFPDNYEVHFANKPQKKVSIHILKMIKNEPVV